MLANYKHSTFSTIPENEKILSFNKGSAERIVLNEKIEHYKSNLLDVPIIIGGKEFKTPNIMYQVMPHQHTHKLAKFYHATPDLIEQAIEVGMASKSYWENLSFEKRADFFLKAADLVSNKYRMDLLATTMLGQAKNVYQAEIDAACELADFLRFNVYFASKSLSYYTPFSPTPNISNSISHRALEGFVAAISPFNFTAIGGNLPTAPALMGNCVLWKPSDFSILSNFIFYRILIECGIPKDVISFIPANGETFVDTIVKSSYLSGINFTGSAAVFKDIWIKIVNSQSFASKLYPRLVGECGGKNFHLVHKSAAEDVESIVHNSIRGAFEYSGQKCSATSRLYVPASLWPEFKRLFLKHSSSICLDIPEKYSTFTSAVIHRNSFNKIKSFIDRAKLSPTCEIICGGEYDNSVGFFITPTIILVKDPKHELMTQELFGPVLTVYAYDDKNVSFEKVIKMVDETSVYALTGSLFCKDKEVIEKATVLLKNCCGNFYINDKSTGSVVNQQPFGGARLSGTNDKAGGPFYLLKWTSIQSTKENTLPLKDFKYEYMQD